MEKSVQSDIKEQLRQQRLMKRMERPFSNEVTKEKNRFVRAQADHWKHSRILSVDLLIEHKQKLTVIFKKHYARVIKAFIGNTERSLQGMKADLFSIFFGEWLNTEGGRKISQTANTTQSDIRKVLNRALAAEEPTERVIASILSAQGFSRFRAETIARTEVHSAAMFASEKTAENISATTGLQILKKWVPALDDRTRISHAAMVSHKSIAMDEFFIVGGEKLKRPGDPRGSAGNIINCRCVLVYPSKK